MKSSWRVAISSRSSFSDKKRRDKGYAHGSSGKQRVRFVHEMVAFVRGQRHRKKHSRDAASAQHRAGRSNRQAGQLRRAHLEQSDQVSVSRRSLSGQCQARSDLGRSLLQGFRQPAGQARSRAGAGAGARLFTNIDDRVVTMEAGPVAIAGQSGAIVMAIRQALEDRGVGVGYMVTTGNEAGLETPDLMAYFAADPGIRVIVVY